jgi:hypothetical protein
VTSPKGEYLDEDFENDDFLTQARAQSMQAPSQASQWVDESCDAAQRQNDTNRCCELDGYTLHAQTAIASDDREGLLRLLRYGKRHFFASDQLSLRKDGRVRYHLKRPWGPRKISELVLEPSEFLHRLAALIPPRYFNTTRFHGIFAPNSRRRLEIAGQHTSLKIKTKHPSEKKEPLDADIQKDLSKTREACDEKVPIPRVPVMPPSTRLPWSELLRRVFSEDILTCPKCHQGTLKIIAFITEAAVVTKILSHVGLSTEMPKPEPARFPQQAEFVFEDSDDRFEAYEQNNETSLEEEPFSRVRGPPEEI